MPFHRYVDPSYNLIGGSFPGTIGSQPYDRVNVVSGGVGGGDGSSNADAAKSGGPNAGTYFVAFGEDASSAFANRGLRALAQNTDFLDDIVRGSIPRRNTANFPAPNAFTLTLTGLEVFVGDNLGVDPNELVYVVDQTTGEQLYDSTGAEPIRVTAITNGAGPSVIGNGWFTAPRLTLSGVVDRPVRVYYGSRTSIARKIEVPDRDTDFSLAMLALAEAKYGASLYKHGLNERYRRSTGLSVDPDTVTADTPGDGARIERDGQALMVYGPEFDAAQVSPAGAYPDPFLALYNARHDPASSPIAGTERQYDGTIGFLNVYPNRIVWTGNTAQTEAGEAQARGRFHAGFLSCFPMNVSGASLTQGGAVRTRLQIDTPASSSGSTITVSSPYRVGDPATGERDITNNVDVVGVTFSNGASRVYLVTNADPVANTLTVATLGGAAVTLPNDSVSITLYQVTYRAGGNNQMVVAPPRPVNSYNGVEQPPFIAAPVKSVLVNTVEFGHFDKDTGDLRRTFVIRGDGGVDSYGGILQHCVAHRRFFTDPISDLVLNVAPGDDLNDSTGLGASAFYIQASALAGNDQLITINVPNASSTLISGTQLEFVIENVNGGTVDVAWDSTFLFSDPSDAETGAARVTQGAVVRWTGTVHSTSVGNRIFMDRLDYTLS